jgi:hypothetical protein
MIQKVGGYKPCTVTDFEIPKRYGLWQTIADTLGIGGIMRALRTIPVLVEMCHEMERVCSNVVHLNYVNPMAMNCWVLNQAAKVRTVGLCHSVPHTAEELAHDIGVPIEEINYVVAGIKSSGVLPAVRTKRPGSLSGDSTRYKRGKTSLRNLIFHWMNIPAVVRPSWPNGAAAERTAKSEYIAPSQAKRRIWLVDYSQS